MYNMAGQGVEKYFFQVKQEVTSDWKDLAFFLGFDGPEIDNIDGRNRDDRSRCMDMLQEWKRKNKDAATTEVLMEALSNAGLQSVVHGLKAKRIRTGIRTEPATQPETLTQPQQETMGQPLSGKPEPVSSSQPEPASSWHHYPVSTGQTELVPSWQPPQAMVGPSRKSDVPARPEGPKLFIVHGGEDKESLVEPLAHEIVDQGVPKENVFYDEWSIEHATSIKESIAVAIQDRSCKLAVIVVSEDMMKKYWPKKEFEEFLKRGIRFFPIFYGVDLEDVRVNYSPTLADTRGVEINRTGTRVDDNTIAGTASTIRKILRSL